MKSEKQENPFKPLTEKQILADLAESRKQIAEGKVISAEEVMKEISSKWTEIL